MKAQLSKLLRCCRGAPEGGAGISRVRCGELNSIRGEVSGPVSGRVSQAGPLVRVYVLQ